MTEEDCYDCRHHFPVKIPGEFNNETNTYTKHPTIEHVCEHPQHKHKLANFNKCQDYFSREVSNSLDVDPGFCFIATAAYGNPLEKELYVLREFRDKHLKKSPIGVAFIATYYKVGPTAGKIISKNEFLKGLVRKVLDPVVKLVESQRKK